MSDCQTATSITAGSSHFIDYLLAELRCAALRARLMHNDIIAIGIAFKAGLIDADNALEHLADCGALHLVAPSSVVTRASS
jgi:hypothetical protein